MITQHTKWSKDHLIYAIRYAAKHLRKDLTDFYEFGVYRGESCLLIENLCKSYGRPVRQGFGFDSFQGLPEEQAGVDRFYLFNPGVFNDVAPDKDRSHPWGMFPTTKTKYISGWFSDLKDSDVKKYDMQPAFLVHIDSDIYKSAVESLDFMFRNKLILPGTVLGYDELKSTKDISDGGESLAHIQMCEKYKVDCTELFRNTYTDDIELWQSIFIINSIGEKANHGIN